MNQLLWNLYFKGMNLYEGIVYAGENGGSVADQLNGLLNTVTTWAQPICMIALIFCGIGWVFAGKKGADGPKETLKNVCIGIAIILGVTVIWNIIQNFVGGINTL